MHACRCILRNNILKYHRRKPGDEAISMICRGACIHRVPYDECQALIFEGYMYFYSGCRCLYCYDKYPT